MAVAAVVAVGTMRLVKSGGQGGNSGGAGRRNFCGLVAVAAAPSPRAAEAAPEPMVVAVEVAGSLGGPAADRLPQ